MKVLKVVPMGAAIFALSLGLFSVAPSPARAADDESGTNSEKNLIRIVGDDIDSDPNLIRIVQQDRDDDGDLGNRDRESDSGYLGVQVQRLTSALRRAKGIPENTDGTLVNNVEDGSPADDGGIKRGDVILEVNRQSATNPNDLVRIVRGLEPGRKVPVQIWRDGVTRTVSVKVSTRPEGSEFTPRPMPRPEPPEDVRVPDIRDVPEVRDAPEVRDVPEVRGLPNDGRRMQILRRNTDDLQRQLREIREALSKLRDEDLVRLERQIRELRSELQRSGALERRDRDRNDDRDRDDNERD